MLNKIFALSIACIVISFSGCGGSGSDDGLNLDAQIEYKTSGTYDLRNYIVPLHNSFNVYNALEYQNDDGKKRFDKESDEYQYTEKYDINTSGAVIRNSEDEVKGIYEFQSDRIVSIDNAGKLGATIVRYANIGDYIAVINTNDTTDNIPTNIKTVCKLLKHYDTKMIDNREYVDVLEIKCITKEVGELKGSSVSLKYKADAASTNFWVNGKGIVKFEEVNCDELETVLNGQKKTQSTCFKDINSLISHNRL